MHGIHVGYVMEMWTCAHIGEAFWPLIVLFLVSDALVRYMNSDSIYYADNARGSLLA